MAAITITPSSVVKSTGAQTQTGFAGGTITAGMAVFLNSSQLYVAADANDTTIDEVTGIALNSASTGQPVCVQTSGNITIGGTVVAGTIYVLGASVAGDINPAADLASGWARCIIGVASSTSVIVLGINNTGVIG